MIDNKSQKTDAILNDALPKVKATVNLTLEIKIRAVNQLVDEPTADRVLPEAAGPSFILGSLMYTKTSA